MNLEERVAKLEQETGKETIPGVLGRMIQSTETEIKAEADKERLDVLHYRLQEYLRLAIQHNNSW